MEEDSIIQTSPTEINFFHIRTKFSDLKNINQMVGYLAETIKRLQICNTTECVINKDLWKITDMAFSLEIMGFTSLQNAQDQIKNDLELERFTADYYEFVRECYRVLHETWVLYNTKITQEAEKQLKHERKMEMIKEFNNSNIPIAIEFQNEVQDYIDKEEGYVRTKKKKEKTKAKMKEQAK